MSDRAPLKQRLLTRMFGGVSGGVFRGMATLALGSGIGRVIGVAAYPVLTRLYTPEDFGILAVFTALVAILAPLVTLRYVLALPLPHHDGVAINLLAVSAGLMLSLSALVGVALWLFGEALLPIVSMGALTHWWWLIALGVLGTAAYEMLTMWATRKRAYKSIAQTAATQSAAGALAKIGLGLMSLQPSGLLLGQVVTQAGGIGQLLRSSVADFRTNWRHVTAPRMQRAAWKHRGFPIWRVPSQFLMVFSMQSPTLFIAFQYDAETTGQFSLAMMALSVPLSVLGNSVGHALYGEAARVGIREPQRLLRLAQATQKRLFLLAVVPACSLFLFGPQLFRFVFSPEWEAAGHFASTLSIYMLFQFTSSPMIKMINILEAQHIFLGINLLRAAGLVALSYGAYLFDANAMDFTTIFSVFNAAVYAIISWYIIQKLKLHAAGASILQRKDP